jgi:hypothetical protein
MSIDAHVACRPTQTLALAIRNMLLGLGVAVLLRHAKIDDKDRVGRLGRGSPDQEVVGLDIAVDEILLVNGLDASEL